MPSPNDRRTRMDRRTSEDGPPDGWKERRRNVERRRPLVTEITFREWVLRLIEWEQLSRAK